MSRKGTVTDTHIGNSGKCGLQGGHQLTFELAVQIFPGVGHFHISAYIHIKTDGIHHAIGIFPMTADGDINVQPNVPVHYAEGHRIGRSVLISNDFLSVKKIYSLILGGLSAKGEPDTEGFKGTPHILSQISVKDGGFAGRIINVFSGLGAHIHHFPLIHNHHALSFIYRDNRSVGYHVLAPFFIGTSSGGFLASFYCKDIGRNRITIEIFFPLIRHYRCRRLHCRSD